MAAFVGARRLADPRVPDDHAAREPDRLGSRADDLLRGPRAVVVPRQRPRPRRRPAEAPVRETSTCSASTTSRSSARSSSTSPRSSTYRGLLRRRDRALPDADAPRAERARDRRGAGRGRRDGDQRRGATAIATCSPAARSPGSAAPATASAITPGWTDGDSLVGGAGWIAIALVIFAFWRPELCLVGAYLFGGLSGGLPSALQAHGYDDHAGGPQRASVRHDHRRARARLVRARAPPAGRARCARHRRTCGRSGDGGRLARDSLEEALRVKAEHPDALPIQGGTDVMVELNFDRRRPEVLLNLNEVPELRGWSRENGTLRLGVRADLRGGDGGRGRRGAARARARRRGRSARRRSATAGRSAGTSAPRRRPATRCRRCSSRRRRSSSPRCAACGRCRCGEFLVGPKRNAAEPDELISAVLVEPSGAPQTFMKVGPRNAMVIAVCSLAVVADRERGELRASFGSVGPGRRASSPCPLGRGGVVRRAGRRGGEPDRRRPRHGRLPAPRAARAGRACAGAGAGMRIALTVNGDRPRGRRLAGREPALRAARAARPARLEERLRAGRVRLVLGAPRRHARVRVPRARGAGRRPRGRHGRGPGRRRRAAPRPGGVRRGRRSPVRLLHAGPRRRDRRPAPAHAPTRARTRSARRSPATSAAAPGTRRSSTPSASRRERAMSTTRPTRKLEVGRIGEVVPRADGIPKTTGEFAYASDLWAAGMLWGHTVRSPHAHARILEIDISEALAMPGVHAVLTHDDVPGAKTLRPRVPRPAGARDRPRPLLRRAGRARRGRAPGAGAACGREGRASSTSRSSSSSTPSARPSRSRCTRTGRRWGTATATTRGRTSSGTWSSATATPTRPGDVTVEGVYEIGIQDQAFLGPESGLAVPDGEGGVDIYVATQWLHVDRDQVAPCLGLAPEQVRIHLAGVGGAFGGREDLSMQIHGAMLALHTSRPVKIVYGREESFVGHVHRHPAKIWAEHRATREGRLVCVRMRILLDGGAYASSSTAVTSNAASFACGPVRGAERADRVDLRLHEQPAVRRDARLRRRADLLRRRGADGQARRGARDRPGRAAAPERARPGRHAADRAGDRGLAAGRRGDPPRRRARAAAGRRSSRATRSVSPGGAGNTTRGEGVQRGIGFAVGFKNICYSEGFDDFCAARVILSGEPRRDPLRRRRGRPGRQRRHPPGRPHGARPRRRSPLAPAGTAMVDSAGSASASRLT